MIFVTVGSQMPFDRLVMAIDKWAGENRGYEVQAQVGDSNYRARYIRTCVSLTPVAFKERVRDARAVVAHAGMGSVITALEFRKPLVVMPRRGDLRETRNDHQIATARWLAEKPGITVAMAEVELGPALERALSRPALGGSIPPNLAEGRLTTFLSNYLTQVAGQ